MGKIHQMTETGLLAALIFVTGLVKIPGLIPGSEFQLSAPLAVAICAIFGFRCYITAGVIASLIGLVIGGQNLLNIFVAMTFRLTVGGVMGLAGTSWPVLLIAGPLGSLVARLALSGLVGLPAWSLFLAALPGMAYTALSVWPVTVLLRRVRAQAERGMTNALQR